MVTLCNFILNVYKTYFLYLWILKILSRSLLRFFYEMIKRFLAALDPNFDAENAAKNRGFAGGSDIPGFNGVFHGLPP